jgi:hypothetical protein
MVIDPLEYIYVIYKNPKYYPEKYVVRKFHYPTRMPIDPPVKIATDLETARKSVNIGRYRIMRHPSDDPCVIEAWL